MSCTVLALPYALAWVVGTIITNVAENAISSYKSVSNSNTTVEGCDDVEIITEKHFIEKEFKTPFMDKEILLKTINEHGANNISENNEVITANVEGYILTFKKNDEASPYVLKITCAENSNAEEKLEDLNSEYALNVQEDAYLHILEKLKENNMQIEQEEVMDDNTIVLTVNIE